jgi:hypothetical protein
MLAQLEGIFLESKLPVRAFATLTAPGRMAQHTFDKLFSTWIQGVQAHNRLTVGWIKAEERAPQRHLHAALVATSSLDCVHAAQLWRFIAAPRYSEAAKVEPYRKGVCGLGYVLKTLGSSFEDVQFSPNLPAFASNLRPVFRTNSAQRRQHRRIMQQFEQTAH